MFSGTNRCIPGHPLARAIQMAHVPVPLATILYGQDIEMASLSIRFTNDGTIISIGFQPFTNSR
jgi:hypothetical protein